MKVFFCRHGETEWNVQGRLQGHLDSALSETGVQQACKLGIELLSVGAELIISSDLGRAEATAQWANKQLNLPIQMSSLLRERSFGVLEGILRCESNPLWQAYDRRFHGDDMDIEGAETTLNALDRIKLFLEHITELGLESVIVICHGEWLRILQNYLNGATPWSESYSVPANCGIVKVSI
ncbi:histidine phosphatase family protein [Shewanella sp. KT0246]|uniref:histidine phosphatase family protein n=1 Tax=Shewanella sp. KT0246 TaxID=2815912 RepID=UPI001BC54602|nr:histidine phosphatase family protein [Shewanella sp. KT0246]GIU48414.1 hypothetical protein TUM4249_03650 [Shewanella sp. KT0246]